MSTMFAQIQALAVAAEAAGWTVECTDSVIRMTKKTRGFEVDSRRWCRDLALDLSVSKAFRVTADELRALMGLRK